MCDYHDKLISTWNPELPQDGNWQNSQIHPCSRQYSDISENESQSDYTDLLNTVQRHTRCSTKYCLRHVKGSTDLQCRFNYPFDCCEKTQLLFEQIHTRDNTPHYKAKVIIKRNDPRLNNHQKTQLQGWRANCDIQVIIDHHACAEYLTKYAAKGEPRSSVLGAFNGVIGSNNDLDSEKAVKKIMIKTLGQRDFGAQETMHLLLSLKLYSSTFHILPVNLNGSRRIKTKTSESQYCTTDSLLDVYANRKKYQDSHPKILDINLLEFVRQFKVVNDTLQNQNQNVVPRVFPNYSPNPGGKNYSLYCKYQLLKYKSWKDSINDGWGSENPDDNTYISAW